MQLVKRKDLFRKKSGGFVDRSLEEFLAV